LVRALAKTDAATVRQQIGDIGFAAVEIRLDDRADGRTACANAFREFDGELRVKRPLQVDAQKIIEARGALQDGENQTFAEFNIDIEAELRELAGNVSLQPLL